MIKSLMTVSCIGVLTLVGGCDEQPNNPTPTTPTTGATGTTGTTAPSTAAELKTNAVRTAQSAYDAAKKQVDDLGAKIEAAPEATRTALNNTYEGIKEQLDNAEDKLTELKDSTGDAWSRLSGEVTTLIESIRKSANDLAGQLAN